MAREPKELTDEELNLRRKARRRLVGAVALTLAVVVVLPMVLESQPKPTGQDIDLRIPAPDKAGPFVAGVVTTAVSAPLPQVESGVAATSAVSVAPEPASAVAVPAPAAAKPEIGPPTAAKVEKTVEKVPEKIAAAATDKGYALQIGAYSNPDTAKQECDKLKKWGFKAYTEKAGDKTRVRVGPYEQRDKADKVAKMLEKHALHPTIVGLK